MTSSNGNNFALLAICAGNSPVPGEFPAQRPVTRSFDVFFDLCLNKRLRKQSWGGWFETLSRPLWRQCNELTVNVTHYPGNQVCPKMKVASHCVWNQRQLGCLLDSLFKQQNMKAPHDWPFAGTLQRRHNERDGVSNHQPHECLLNRLFKAHMKQNIKAPRHWPSPVTGEFPAQRASTAENVSNMVTSSWEFPSQRTTSGESGLISRRHIC